MALSCMYSAAKGYQGVATSHRNEGSTPQIGKRGARLPDLFADIATQLHPTAGTDRYGPGHDST